MEGIRKTILERIPDFDFSVIDTPSTLLPELVVRDDSLLAEDQQPPPEILTAEVDLIARDLLLKAGLES